MIASRRALIGRRVQADTRPIERARRFPDRSHRWLAGCGIAGPVLLALYFSAPTAVPQLARLLYGRAPGTRQIVVVGADDHLLLAAGSWLQGIGALLCVLFLLALVHWAGGSGTLAGRLVLLGVAVLLAVVLAEMVFTLTWASAARAGQQTSARVAYDLMARFTRVFPIIPAPTVYLSLAAVLAAGQPVLPAIFTRLAAALGVGFVLVGVAGVLTSSAAVGSAALSGLQDLWILAAGIITLRRTSS
jgi:hypothetical protein